MEQEYFLDVISKKGGHVQYGYVTQRLYFEICLGKEVMNWVVSLKNAEKKWESTNIENSWPKHAIREERVNNVTDSHVFTQIAPEFSSSGAFLWSLGQALIFITFEVF